MRKNTFKSGLLALILGSCSQTSLLITDQLADLNPTPKITYTQKDSIETETLRHSVSNLREEICNKYDIDIQFGNPKWHDGVSDQPPEKELFLDEIVIKLLLQDLTEIYKPLRLKTKTIYFGIPHFLIRLPNGEPDFPTGFAFDDRPGEILIDPLHYSKSLATHEMAHAKEIQEGESFSQNWNEVVKVHPAYSDGEEWKTPKEGFIRGYGRRGPYTKITPEGKVIDRWQEDTATFVEEAYAPGFGNFKLVNPSDYRYAMKVCMLRENDYISQEQFEGIIKILGDDYDSLPKTISLSELHSLDDALESQLPKIKSSVPK